MIVVASYNMRKAVGTDRVRRPERILEVLSEIDADIIALQEADRRFGARTSALPLDLVADRSAYKHVPFDMRPGSLGWHGNALLVRKTANILRHRPLFLPTIEPRGAVCADIELHGQTVRVIGMHLDISGLQRRRQVREILAHVDDDGTGLPCVMMGDLNEWNPHGRCIKDFCGSHHMVPTAPSFHARRPIARLDRIFVSPAFDILASGTHHSACAARASDHLPVWARLKLKG